MKSRLNDDMDKDVDVWYMKVSDAAFYTQSLQCCVGNFP